MTWRKDINPESKLQYTFVLMSEFNQQKMHNNKPRKCNTSTLLQKAWERERIDKICASALTS
jgi:hypothetical protein